MRIREKFFFLTMLLLVLSNFSDAKDDLFQQVSNKLAQDKEAFAQFKYLGQVHCLDKRFKLKEGTLFFTEEGSLFNHRYGFPRLINREKLIVIYQDFEKHHEATEKDLNPIEQCVRLYSEENLKQLYIDTVHNQENYNTINDTFIDEEDMQGQMNDYLRLGKIDAKRFL